MSLTKRTITKTFLLLLLTAALLLLLAQQFYTSELTRKVSLKQLPDSVFEVAKGESFHSVIRRLHELAVIQSPLAAKLYIRQHELGGQLKVGEFALSESMNLSELLQLLITNQTVQYQIQFIEGQSYRSIFSVLSEHPKIKHTLSLEDENTIRAALGMAGDLHLEGQFYPDTYQFPKGETDVAILRRAHQRLLSILQEEWDQRAKPSPLKTSYEALILASIIEKETGVSEERAEIAGVFIRRLNKGMRLQTDPTVIYGLGDRYQGNITRKHLREYTPYNTYRIKGLPPTPIAMAGRAAIHAALNPKKGDTLYFVAKGDGTHQFSKTIEEHNRAVRQYQLNRRKDYRSSQ